MNNRSMLILSISIASFLSFLRLCAEPIALSHEHIEQVKQGLISEESKIDKFKKATLAAAVGGMGGLSYYAYKWATGLPVPEGLSQEQLRFIAQHWQRLQLLLTWRPVTAAQEASGQLQLANGINQQQYQAQAGNVPEVNQNRPAQSTRLSEWRIFSGLNYFKNTFMYLAKAEAAHQASLFILNKFVDIYTDRNLSWFIARRTILPYALDDLKKAINEYDSNEQESCIEVENTLRYTLTELESMLGFMLYTVEHAQAQAQKSVAQNMYIARLRVSNKRIMAIAQDLIEQVTLLLNTQSRPAVVAAQVKLLIDSLSKEIQAFKAYEPKTRMQ